MKRVIFELRLLRRFHRLRKRGLARFTSLVAVIGIAVGVGSLILALALAHGFQDEMRDKILANTAHIAIFKDDGREVADWQEIKNGLDQTSGVRSVAASTYESVVLTGPRSTSYAILKVQDSRSSPNPNSGLPEISMGAELADRTGLTVGSTAEVVVLTDDEPKTTTLRVNDIFRTGLYDYDSTWAYISPEDIARLYGVESFTPTTLNISVDDIYSTAKISEEIRGKLGAEFRVLDWQEANQPLFAALSLEKRVAIGVISLIILIAVLSITSTLALLVNERRLDIAVMRTCGARSRSLLSLFVMEGLFLALVGTLAGVGLALLGCLLSNYFGLISLPGEVYSLNSITLRPSLADISIVVLVSLSLSTIATLYPAYSASRIKPLENLRNT